MFRVGGGEGCGTVGTGRRKASRERARNPSMVVSIPATLPFMLHYSEVPGLRASAITENGPKSGQIGAGHVL